MFKQQRKKSPKQRSRKSKSPKRNLQRMNIKMRFADDVVESAPDYTFELTKPQIKVAEKLPKKIIDDIIAYTGDSSINDRLAANMYVTDLQKQLTKKDIQMSDSLDLALANMPPLESDIVLYKGTKNARFLERNIVVPGYTSTSADVNVAARFTGDSCCLNVIHVKKGSYVLPITSHMSKFNQVSGFHTFEAEYLLPRFGDFVYLKTEFVRYYTISDEYIRYKKRFISSSEVTTKRRNSDDFKLTVEEYNEGYPELKVIHFSYDNSQMEI